MKKILLITLVCFLALAPVAKAQEDIRATAMRMERTEGEAALSGKNGIAMMLFPGMKLFSGNMLDTAVASYVWISLDESKVVKMNEESRTEVVEDGKDLTVLLHKGELFFNVTAPVDDDASFQIQTSTMITGIRGTSGTVSRLSDERSRVCIYDGEVTVETDTGIYTETVIIRAGEKVDILVDSSQPYAPAEVLVERLEAITKEDVPGYVRVELRDDPALRERMEENTQLDVQDLVDTAEEKLRQEQEEHLAFQEEAEKQLALQEEPMQATLPVFAPQDQALADNDRPGKLPDIDTNLPIATTVTVDDYDAFFTKKDGGYADEGQLAKLYAVGAVNVILGGQAPLTFSKALEIPSSKSLSLRNGQNGSYTATANFTVSGRLVNQSRDASFAKLINHSMHTVVNEGTLKTESLDNSGGNFVNQGELSLAGGKLDGKLENAGQIRATKVSIGGNIANKGDISLSGGDLVGKLEGGKVTFEKNVTIESMLKGIEVANTGTLQVNSTDNELTKLTGAGKVSVSGGLKADAVDSTGSVDVSGKFAATSLKLHGDFKTPATSIWARPTYRGISTMAAKSPQSPSRPRGISRARAKLPQPTSFC